MSTDRSIEEPRLDVSIISSHATSDGFVVYYRRADGTVGMLVEPRTVMPKHIDLPQQA